jgi:hypothetical protein
MLSMTLVMVAMVVGSHGEAPREVKFQGALLAQADLPAPPPANTINTEALQKELDQLTRERPTLISPVVLISSGAANVVLCLASIAGIVATGSGVTGTLGFILLLTALISGPVGIVLGIIGLVALPIQIIRRTEANDRVQELRTRLGKPSSPSAGRDDFGGGAVLAAF